MTVCVDPVALANCHPYIMGYNVDYSAMPYPGYDVSFNPFAYVVPMDMQMAAIPYATHHQPSPLAAYAPLQAAAPASSPALYAPVPQPSHSAVLAWAPDQESDWTHNVHHSPLSSQSGTASMAPVAPTYVQGDYVPQSELPVAPQQYPPGMVTATAPSYLQDTPTFLVGETAIPSTPSALERAPVAGTSAVACPPHTIAHIEHSSSQTPAAITSPTRPSKKRKHADDEDDEGDADNADMLEARADSRTPSDVELLRRRRKDMINFLGFVPSDP